LYDTDYVLRRETTVSHSRGSKVKSQNQRLEGDVFWMSLEDAKRALTSRYEFLEDRLERRSRKKNA
jgi:hypothetical protein